jgi:hypothetical protein
MKHEWKKAEKQFYQPANEPVAINVPPFGFFTVEGEGDPNDKSFSDYITLLYSLSYAVKMSPRNGFDPKGYFDYSVYPLEGIWDINEEAKKQNAGKLDKSTLVFKLMIRQPDFVTADFAYEIITMVKRKKPHYLLEKAKFEIISDGESVQMMHSGSYDSEPASFKRMEDFCLEHSFTRKSKRHREIYLSDARKVSPEKLKTVLRFGII